jgi:uncharacterized protein (TIGR03437 family)
MWFCSLRFAFLLSGAAMFAWGQALPTLSLTPATVNFTYQIGSTQFPAAQTVQVKRSGAGAALDYTVTLNPAAPWLIVTPMSGKTGTAISLRVNPTSLIAGTYTTVLQVDATGSAGPVGATIRFTVKNPPPTMAATPATLAFDWRTDASSDPAPQTIAITTNGEPFTVTAVGAGGTWLSLAPTVGVVLSGSPFTVTVSVATAGLVPGTYNGKVTLTSLTAANKSISITVTLTVTPGTAVIGSIWPNAAPIGSEDATITIRGSHLFKASVVKANTTDLTVTWISADVMLAVIPKSLLAAQATLQITVNNSPQPASNVVNFDVTPPGPRIQTVLNAASFAVPAGTPAVAPGEIVSVFGSGLGPGTALLASPVGGAFPTTLGTPAAVVEFETISGSWVAAPIISIHANQINCQAPFGITTTAGLRLRVSYNAITSATLTFDGVAAEPGVFTVDSSGRGQAAALNYSETTQAYSLNNGSNPVPKGGVLILFLTGAGAINPLPVPEGQLSPVSPLPAVVAAPSVSIGGEAASVLSATAVPGALGGLVQLNVSVPGSLKAGKELAVVVSVSGRNTPATATVAVK